SGYPTAIGKTDIEKLHELIKRDPVGKQKNMNG
ncbi:unnamed protein product, partial [Rotaria sp. Silwood1]